jgi:negative regulator of genetic competence, sporulation and motility
MKRRNDDEVMSEDGWVKADNVEVEVRPRKDRVTVFTMKMDSDLLRALVDCAREKDMPTSTLARELIREGLLGMGKTMPAGEIVEILKTKIEEQEAKIGKLEKKSRSKAM